MSTISGSCCESTAQTLFNQHIQERQLKSKDDELKLQQDPFSNNDETRVGESGLQSRLASKQVTEANKGQLLDLYV